jgi:hypothetical protein
MEIYLWIKNLITNCKYNENIREIEEKIQTKIKLKDEKCVDLIWFIVYQKQTICYFLSNTLVVHTNTYQ